MVGGVRFPSRLRSVLVVTLAVLLAGHAAHASLITSNLGESTNSYVDLDVADWFAASFTTDGQTYTFTQVTLDMADAGAAGGNFVVSLRADNSGVPAGSSLTGLSGSAAPTSAGQYAYTGTYSLAANTTYWVVAGVSSGSGDYRWNFTDSFAQTGPGSIGDEYGFSGDQGTSWTTPGSGPQKLSVEGTPTGVPEPSSVVLFACALAGGALRSGRTARQTS
ncbi:MAG: hypothetical protein HY815_26720 [Candidatus Riflebacteria bacterium]|nr:hypothetical protein [Candidatus Riflebacteria bacterium]